MYIIVNIYHICMYIIYVYIYTYIINISYLLTVVLRQQVQLLYIPGMCVLEPAVLCLVYVSKESCLVWLVNGNALFYIIVNGCTHDNWYSRRFN